MTFAKKLIDVTFALGKNAPGDVNVGPENFQESGTDQVTVSGLRVSVKIVKGSGNSMSTAEIRIYGMTLSLMNQLSTLGLQATHYYKNSVLVQAGEEGSGVLAIVFVGSITNAWVDFQASPEVAFHVEAATGAIYGATPAKPVSYNGPTAVADIMSSLAAQMDLTFENSGVNTVLDFPYFYGSPRAQFLAVKKQANINAIIDNNSVLAIWPKGAARNGQVPLISPQTGMVGYPAYTSKGIALTTLYNPSIGLGQQIQVESSLQPATGSWITYMLDHDLESQVLNGQWFTRVEAARPGFGPVIGGGTG